MPAEKPRSIFAQLAERLLFAVIRTGQCAASNTPPRRYCRPCARPRLSRIVFWAFEEPGYCADCGVVLGAREGSGCID